MKSLRFSALASLLAGLAYSATAGAQAMFINPDGDIGVGTDDPLGSLEVTRSDGTARILVSETIPDSPGARTLFEILNNGNPEFRLTNTRNGNSWVFSAGLRFVVKNNLGDSVMRVTDTGDLEITGALFESSDVAKKTDIVPVKPDEVLEKVVELPIAEWAYKERPEARHIGPMAQDFHAAFATGTSDKQLAMMDVGGVAIASIQALARQNEALESSNRELQAENAKLEKRLTMIEAMLAEWLPDSAKH